MNRIIRWIEKTILIGLLCISISGATVSHAKETYTHTETFSKEHELTGLFATAQEYFQAGQWDVKEITLNLSYTVTSMLNEKISNFTVYLNGQPVYSTNVPVTNGETQELSIQLPADLVKEGPNYIEVETYVRINNEDPCMDDISNANWMVLLKDSYVTVSYIPLEKCENIADIYKQLTSIEGLENKESAVLLPQDASETELSGAAWILSGISKNAALYYNKLELTKVKNYSDVLNKKYAVYFSEYDDLFPQIKSLLSTEQDKAAKEGAILVLLKTSQGNNLMVVTGKNKDALLNAARLFGNKEYINQTKMTWKKITENETVSTEKNQGVKSYLTTTGSYVKGPFRHTASFTISLGKNQMIAAGSEVALRFRYAENLDFTRSLVTVYIGDTPIGSKKLEKVNAGADYLRLAIPDNLNLNGDVSLQVTFDLEMLNFSCSLRKDEMPWAYVSNESTLHLVTKEIPYLLFDYYPAPFIKDGKLNEVVVVLPVRESREDLEAMRKILLTIGRFQKDNGGSIRVCRSDNMGNLEASNIISIGCYSGNPIAKQMNDNLYFQFNSEGTTIQSNEKMRIEANYGITLGTAQLLYSPYGSKKNALLIVSGVKPEGINKAANYLGDIDKLWNLAGDGMVVDDEAIYCQRFGTDNAKQISFLEQLLEQKDLMLLLVMGGSAIFLLLLSVILLFHKQRKK